MQFDYKNFKIEIGCRREGSKYVGNVRIYGGAQDGRYGGAMHNSGDLPAFDANVDAVIFAQQLAVRWVDCNAH